MDHFSQVDYSIKDIKNEYTNIISQSEYDIAIKIKNNNYGEGLATAKTIKKLIDGSNFQGIEEIFIGAGKGKPGYDIYIDRDMCFSYGVNVETVTGIIKNITQGTEITQINKFDQKIALRLYIPELERESIEKIADNTIIGKNGIVKISKLIKIKKLLES